MPGGIACFIEPLSDNPLLKLFRRLTPHARTIDEKPLDGADLSLIAESFSTDHEFVGLISAPIAMATSIIFRPWSGNIFLRIADRVEKLVNGWDRVQTWNQYVLIKAAKT